MKTDNGHYNEARLRSILDNVVDAIVTIDAKGCIENFNKAAERMFCYSAGEVVGQNVKMLMPEPYCGHHDKYIGNFTSSGIAKVIGKGRDNLEGRRKDGSIFPMYLAVNKMMIDGKIMFTGIISDITERKRYEDQLKTEKENATREAKTKSHYLSVMSHDIRTPISAMLGIAEQLGAIELPDNQKNDLEAFKKAGNNILGIIDGAVGVTGRGIEQANPEHAANILVVDDSIDNRKLIGHILKKAGYKVTEANGGEEALKLVDESPPDLILLDIEMPGINGFEVCATLKRSARSRDLPVIFLSAKSETSDKVMGFEIGGVDYITKPFDRNEVLARVNNQIKIKNLANNILQTNMELNEKQSRLDADLDAAAEIQQTLLPHELPTVNELNFAWKFSPCDQIGGDIFNVFQIDDENIALYILDVSGHGAPSAMVTVSVAQMLRQQSALRKNGTGGANADGIVLSPCAMLNALDNEYPVERFGKFFTIVYMIINIHKGSIVCSNAGHPAPVILQKDGNYDFMDKGGTIIGMQGATKYEEQQYNLKRGDKIIMFTDGAPEYMNDKGEIYGEDRFYKLLTGCKDLDIDQTLDHAFKSLTKFGNNTKLQDDLSLLGVEYKV